jgi:hypothetical protein
METDSLPDLYTISKQETGRKKLPRSEEKAVLK